MEDDDDYGSEEVVFSVNSRLPERLGDLKIVGKVDKSGTDPMVTLKCLRKNCKRKGEPFRRRLYRLKTTMTCCPDCAATEAKDRARAEPPARKGPKPCEYCMDLPWHREPEGCPECGGPYAPEKPVRTRVQPIPSAKPAPVIAEVRVDTIRLDGETQARVALDEFVIDEYRESIIAGEKLPPPIVFYDGRHHWLGDGFHRVHAYKRAGTVHVMCEVKGGGKRDAILYSVGANATHGLRRTREDKRRAVSVLLADREWSKQSDRWIAEKCAVSPNLVNTMRHEQLSSKDSSATPPTPGVAPVLPMVRKGLDGKKRVVKPRLPKPTPAWTPQAGFDKVETVVHEVAHDWPASESKAPLAAYLRKLADELDPGRGMLTG